MTPENPGIRRSVCARRASCSASRWIWTVALFQLDRNNFILNTGGQYQTAPGATLANALEQYQNIGGVRNRGWNSVEDRCGPQPVR